MRTAQNKKHSKAKFSELVLKNDTLITLAYQQYLQLAQAYPDKARQTLALIAAQFKVPAFSAHRKLEVEGFMAHADRQIDQIRRWVIVGEVIAHGEKGSQSLSPTPSGSAKARSAWPWSWV